MFHLDWSKETKTAENFLTIDFTILPLRKNDPFGALEKRFSEYMR